MRTLSVLSSLSLALGVALGAFGAHGLRDIVSPTDLQIWEKAVLYQMVHGLAAVILLRTASNSNEQLWANRIAAVFLCSIFVFSGSLYTLVLLNLRWMGAITPLGGTGFIVGWCLLAVWGGRGRLNY